MLAAVQIACLMLGPPQDQRKTHKCKANGRYHRDSSNRHGHSPYDRKNHDPAVIWNFDPNQTSEPKFVGSARKV
jgi:hypothetical protein